MKEFESLCNNNELNAFKELQIVYPLKTIVLAGGRGTRLESVTKGQIPKCFVPIDSNLEVKGIDHLNKVFKENNLQDVVFSADFYYPQYKDYIKDTTYSMLYQTENTGNGGAIEQVINEFGYDYQYLVIAPDTYFKSQDLNKLIKNHKPGTISWGVSEELPIMDSYFGLVVHNDTKDVLGDTKLKWWKDWNLDGSKQYVKGAVQIIDPKVFMESMEVFKKLCQKPYPIDLYWDVFPLIEERNRRRVENGQESILKAVVFDNMIVDYGSPDRLDFTRQIFNSYLN